jgi:hypothetical protein
MSKLEKKVGWTIFFQFFVLPAPYLVGASKPHMHGGKVFEIVKKLKKLIIFQCEKIHSIKQILNESKYFLMFMFFKPFLMLVATVQ